VSKIKTIDNICGRATWRTGKLLAFGVSFKLRVPDLRAKSSSHRRRPSPTGCECSWCRGATNRRSRAVWVAHVGSSNERPGITGIAHLFEHMMFKGTPTIGTKDYRRTWKIIAEQERVREREARRGGEDARCVCGEANFTVPEPQTKTNIVTERICRQQRLPRFARK